MVPLNREFYLRDTLTVAKDLLGTYLVHEYNGSVLAGRITETEAYIASTDKACHAYGNRRTPRTEPLYAPGGTSYVYFIYGMYNCMNVVTEPEGVAAAVLIRGVDIVSDRNEASYLRYNKPYETLSRQQKKNFSDGPGKLCKAMAITREENFMDLCDGPLFVTERFQEAEKVPFTIRSSTRIGIDYAEEAKDFLWRFYIEPKGR